MNATAAKSRRQQTILELLGSRAISSQGELAQALLEHGHHVTQSTLSRDLKELRVLRVPAENGYRYLPAGGDTLVSGNALAAGMRGVASAEVLGVEANETVTVVRTQVGRASGVAAFLDSLRLEGVLATLAGDDTILVIPGTVKKTAELERLLAELFGLS